MSSGVTFNVTGVGPQGPAGAQGPVGPQGPPGQGVSSPVRTISSGTTDSSLSTDGLIQWLSTTPGAKTETINAGTTNGQVLQICDGSGMAFLYPVTLVGGNGSTIGGGTSLTLSDNFFNISLKWDNIANWIITNYYGGDKSVAPPSYLMTESGSILETESGQDIII